MAALAAWCAITVAASGQQQPMLPQQMGVGGPWPPGTAYPGGPNRNTATGRGANFWMVFAGDHLQFTGPVKTTGPIQQQGQLGYSTKSGLQITIDASPTSQFGYQPIVVTLSSAQPAAANHSAEVRFSAGTWYNNARAVVVTQSVTWNRGESKATATLLVPQYESWDLFAWEISVDRETDDELSTNAVSFSQQAGSFGLTGLATPVASQPELESALQALNNGNASVRSLPPADWPTDWVRYSTFDVAVMGAEELSQFSAQNPRQAEALLRWVRAGGNLWLIGAGKRWDSLSEAEGVLGVEASAAESGERPTSKQADASLESRGWHFVPLGERALEPFEGALVLSGFDVADAEDAPLTPGAAAGIDGGLPGTAPSAGSSTTTRRRAPVETSRDWFAVRAYGLGTVTAFRGDHSASGSFSGDFPASGGAHPAVAVMQRSLLMPRMASPSRYGNKPDEYNREFNNWLIPGVGVAPVGEFQFLITLFVLAIGPLNYWWFKRQKKLPLLVLTVPAAAAAVTVVLLGYGVLADGFAVRVRARTLTMLDQKAGESATWARLSYYAGLDPRGGLSMPRDTLTYPVLSQYSMGRYGRGPNIERELTWDDDQQRLVHGWLPSRTPTQYLTINSRLTKRRLDLRSTDQGLRVVNRLGAAVTHLAVQDHDGKIYWCENLALDEGRVVTEADPLEVSGHLRQLFAAHLPEYPSGAVPSSYGSPYYLQGLSKNLMEAQFEAINSPVVERWIDGSYIAATSSGIEVDLGLDDATEEESFHLIRGTW